MDPEAQTLRAPVDRRLVESLDELPAVRLHHALRANVRRIGRQLEVREPSLPHLGKEQLDQTAFRRAGFALGSSA
jgi:hypothetical protein